MAKFYVVEKFYYEIEAEHAHEVPELFNEYMDKGEEGVNFSAKFLDNQFDVYDESWDEVKPWL